MTELKPCEYCGGLNFIMDCSRGAYNFLCARCHTVKIYPLCFNEKLIFSMCGVTNNDNARQPAINWQPIEKLNLNVLRDSGMILFHDEGHDEYYIGYTCFSCSAEIDGISYGLKSLKESYTHFAELTPPKL